MQRGHYPIFQKIWLISQYPSLGLHQELIGPFWGKPKYTKWTTPSIISRINSQLLYFKKIDGKFKLLNFQKNYCIDYMYVLYDKCICNTKIHGHLCWPLILEMTAHVPFTSKSPVSVHNGLSILNAKVVPMHVVLLWVLPSCCNATINMT